MAFARAAVLLRACTRPRATQACHNDVSLSGFAGVGTNIGRGLCRLALAYTVVPLGRRSSEKRRPSGYLVAMILPIAVPITSPEITISTRRFCWRPSVVSLEATG